MNRDQERVERNRQALKDAGIDVLVCSLPMNVLLLSGYWPVVGTSLAVFTSEGRSVVLAPEDEKELAAKGWADEVQTFQTGSLDELKSPVEAVGGPLRQVGSGVGRSSRVGFESATVSEPASYAAM